VTPAASPSSLAAALPLFLRHPSPAILTGALASALAGRLALGGYAAADLLPLLALALVWPLQEWLIHVFLLHARPFTLFGRRFDLALARKHRRHHAEPENLGILFIPLASYLYSLPGVALLWWAATPRLELALTGMVGHLALGLRYEWVHFLIHTRYRPRGRWYRRLWRNHRLHHFRNEQHWYGVTMLAADRVLGTGGDEASVAASPTCRTLGVADGLSAP
jgi:sterol desaturase/sphingolipid hydroxylase (fatty acid hydroxylase superfamily)